MQFVAVNFFAGGFSLLQIALMTLAVNIRHMFYGISFLDRFSKMGKKKPYMIFSLTDETYSLLCSAKVPEGVEENSFFFCIALFDQLYWIAGTLAGCVAGALITFDTTGIDFAMTALFTVILVEQLEQKSNRSPGTDWCSLCPCGTDRVWSGQFSDSGSNLRCGNFADFP